MVFHQKHLALQGANYPLPKWNPRPRVGCCFPLAASKRGWQFPFRSEREKKSWGLTSSCLPLLQQGSTLHMAAFCHTFCFSFPPPLLGHFAWVTRFSDVPLAVSLMGEKMKNDSKAPTEKQSQMRLFIEGERNYKLV